MISMLTFSQRAALHAALGDTTRLAIVDDLSISDRSPKELSTRLRVPPNLLAHHLDVLSDAGLVDRFSSAGDARRRYVRLRREPFAELGVATARQVGPVVFVCSHNSARSQLAAAIWQEHTGGPVRSAGTHPAEAVHPEAVAAAGRAGLDLTGAVPLPLDHVADDEQVITVCDRAHEELAPDDDWWHWSVPAPSESHFDDAFDRVVADLDARIRHTVHMPGPALHSTIPSTDPQPIPGEVT